MGKIHDTYPSEQVSAAKSTHTTTMGQAEAARKGRSRHFALVCENVQCLVLALTFLLALNCLASCAQIESGQIAPAKTIGLGQGAQPASAANVDRPERWAQKVPQRSIENLFMIAPGLYRSAQITHSDVAQLSQMGIRTVISLRAFHQDKNLLVGSFIDGERYPLYTWALDQSQIITALRAVQAALQRGPVLIHCQYGADRTGLISAMYRIVFQGWSKQEALDELVHGGYGFHSGWANIPQFIEDADIESLRKQVLGAPEDPQRDKNP